jgi:lysophospholipase L1-like esterase
MKKKAMAALAVALSTALGLSIAEIMFRLAMPPVPGDEGSVAEYLETAQRNPGEPRLFPPGYAAVFDVRGLYEGANKVEFKIGPSRFIPPDPSGPARYKVLFLGGSVTEGIFLPDRERWPARLGQEGEIATYNAAMSAAGMVAQQITAKYLSARGDRFDLVVLATNHNDSTWSRRFADVGSPYDEANFIDGAKKIYEKEFREERRPEGFSLRTLAWARHLLRMTNLDAARAAGSTASGPQSRSRVVDWLAKLQNGARNLPKAPLSDCIGADSPSAVTTRAYEDWKKNLPEFRSQVKKLLGAELLVVSEPAAYGAPGDSFFAGDLRVFPTCATAQGERAIDRQDVVKFERERASAYLEAARAAGAYTFDLAAAMEPFSNGPQGGALFFDGIHPTSKGAAKFADLLCPALRGVLDQLKQR